MKLVERCSQDGHSRGEGSRTGQGGLNRGAVWWGPSQSWGILELRGPSNSSWGGAGGWAFILPSCMGGCSLKWGSMIWGNNHSLAADQPPRCCRAIWCQQSQQWGINASVLAWDLWRWASGLLLRQAPNTLCCLHTRIQDKEGAALTFKANLFL